MYTGYVTLRIDDIMSTMFTLQFSADESSLLLCDIEVVFHCPLQAAVMGDEKLNERESSGGLGYRG